MDWRQCLQSYLESLTSHTTRRDHETTLRNFFALYNPSTVDREQVNLFCTSGTVHGQPSHHTASRRRAAIRDFYDYAIVQGLYQGDNPALPIAKPNVPHLFTDERWQACLTAWLAQLRSPETRSSYTNTIARFFRDPERTPDQYTRAECEAFIRGAHSSQKHNHGQPVKPSAYTINTRRATLASFYRYALDYQIMGDDNRLHPLLQTTPPTKGIKDEVTGPAHRLLTEEDIRRLFSVIPLDDARGIRDRTLFTCYLYLGKRNRELRLRWGDIGPYTFTEKGQSREGYRFRYFAKGKGQNYQFAELPAQVYSQIEWYLLATGRLDDIKPGDGVFVQHYISPDGRTIGYGKEPLSSASIRRILKKYARAAGLDDSACVHSFRHFNATARYRIGQGVLEIADAMDHSSIAITGIYLSGLITGGDPGAPLLAEKLAPLMGMAYPVVESCGYQGKIT